ncbi:MAG: cytochrome c biogenesis protein CcdA [Candidatus Omnitrophota bacterium]|jgi:thiol:disulfide interchange protein DsbD|nr:cytochrome c biogenesis protein CcdA [Candidatus Omnitrophota bacterium]MDD5518536.1 cytochrome c biogenesis protein CcdA [Candidatus Omnitrophota bacterium]
MDYIFAFGGGVLVSLTPCVYPLIPVTVFYISAKSGRSKIRGFILSLIFVTGLAVTYSILGLIASLGGIIFGKISNHPLTLIAVGLIIILFAVSMWLDLFNIAWQGPPRVNTKKKGYFATFLLGLSSGLVASPCLTPALASILAYLAAKKNILYGMSLLMAFAYGMGIILILAGTSSSILINLPKSGKWMAYVKKTGALLLLFIGLYFIYNGMRRF